MLRLPAERTRFIIFCTVSVIDMMIGPSASWIGRLRLGGANRLNLPRFRLSFVAASLSQSPRCPLVQVSPNVST